MAFEVPKELNKPWLIIVAAAFVGGLLIFGSLLWFLIAHIGQIFGFVLIVLLAKSVIENKGVNKNNQWLVIGLLAVALTLLFVPLNIVANLREASVASVLGGMS